MPKTPLEVALRLLAGRDKSRAQLEAALTAKAFSADEVRLTLDRCAQLGYLDDRRAAVDLARKFFAEGRSLRDVERRLEAKGLDPTVARGQPHDELEGARRLLKSKRISGVKAAWLLAARGFEEELVATLVEVPTGDE